MTNWHGNGGSWDVDAPVFEVVWPFRAASDGGDEATYPSVWVSEQVAEPTATTTGRARVVCYRPDDDEGGWEALELGADYYNEGMDTADPVDHEKRVMCFQAAELLYLHAAAKGNPIANLNLGYVYSYDRCEGRYWDPEVAAAGVQESLWDTCVRGSALDVRAYERFCLAAQEGVGEACYKLGDLLRDGRGCEADLAAAFAWFQRAYKQGLNGQPVVWGSAALRLGRAYEEGEGCSQSFDQALFWYERAATGLGIAVREGETWYRRALKAAEDGRARAKQELNGSY